jgi:hypothetical protein
VHPQILAPQKEDRVPGNVQPDTEVFPVPGDVTMRTREINNGACVGGCVRATSPF